MNSLHDSAMNKSRWTPIDELRYHVGTLGEYLLAVRKDGHINFNEGESQCNFMNSTAQYVKYKW